MGPRRDRVAVNDDISVTINYRIHRRIFRDFVAYVLASDRAVHAMLNERNQRHWEEAELICQACLVIEMVIGSCQIKISSSAIMQIDTAVNGDGNNRGPMQMHSTRFGSEGVSSGLRIALDLVENSLLLLD